MSYDPKPYDERTKQTLKKCVNSMFFSGNVIKILETVKERAEISANVISAAGMDSAYEVLIEDLEHVITNAKSCGLK